MTTVPEVKSPVLYVLYIGQSCPHCVTPQVILAKEAGLLYATVGMATDYDCWRETEENVAADAVVKTFKENAAKVTKLFLAAVPKIAASDWSEHVHALKVKSASP